MSSSPILVQGLGIPQFDGTDFPLWKAKMEAVLQIKEVHECIESKIMSDSSETKRKNGKCRSLIIMCLANETLQYVIDIENPYDMWQELKGIYTRNTMMNKNALIRKWQAHKFDETTSLETFLAKNDLLIREAKAAGASIDDMAAIFQLARSMPEAYETAISMIENTDEDKLTLRGVKNRLLDEETKITDKKKKVPSSESTTTAFKATSNYFRGNHRGNFRSRGYYRGNHNRGRSYNNSNNSSNSNNPRSNNYNNRDNRSGNRDNMFRCYSCGKPGHRKSECRSVSGVNTSSGSTSNLNSNSDNKSKIVFFVNSYVADCLTDSEPGTISWYVDSACNEHLCHRECDFVSLDSVEPVDIRCANSGLLKAQKRGIINVILNSDNMGIECDIIDVLFVPELKFNLLSVNKLEANGISVLFKDGKVSLIRCDETLAIGCRDSNGMYKIKFKLNTVCNHVSTQKYVNGLVCSTESTGIDFDGDTIAHDTSKADLWHRRYGHIGVGYLNRLLRSDMVNGLPHVKEPVAGVICKCCVEGKLTALPYKKCTESRSGRVLELIHSDVCSITTVSSNGEKYFVTFIDDFSRFMVIYTMKRKAETFGCFKDYEAKMRAYFNLPISKLRCDRGGEYSSTEFRSFCDGKGIQILFTTGYAPQQNGIAERANRTILDKTRSMLIDSKLDIRFWPHAVKCAAYLINRSPSSFLEFKATPAEVFYGRKPNVSKLKVFGAVVFKHIPDQLRKDKLGKRSEICIMLGYADSGYLVWNIEQNKTEVARDVIFDESKTIANVEPSKAGSVVQIELTSPEPDKDEPNHLEPDSVSDGDEIIEIEEQTIDVSNSSVSNNSSFSSTADSLPNQRPKRQAKLPSRLDDYEVSLNCVQAYVENVPVDYEDAKSRPDSHYWIEAVNAELSSLDKNDTWDLVDPPHSFENIVDCKWVFKIKTTGEEKKYKARLVAKGFQQTRDFDYQEIYSPVIKMETVRTVLAVANQNNYHIHQLDVKSAFLQGDLNEEIFMKQPDHDGQIPGKVCRLKKSIYGLKQASRNWNRKLDVFIKSIGFIRSEYDYCLYYCSINGARIYLLIYVDDIIVISESIGELESVKSRLSNKFDMQDFGELSTFLGIKVERTELGMSFSQQKYIQEILAKFGMTDSNPKSAPMVTKVEQCTGEVIVDTIPYRQLIGCLMFLALGTRPDISVAVNYYSRFQNSATMNHWIGLKHILRYLKGTINLKLFYKRQNDNNTPLMAFADADWGNSNDRKSTSGNLFKVFGNTVAWSTKKQTSVALSSTEAEYISLSAAACEVVWFKNLLCEIGIIIDNPVVIFEDNQSCIAFTVKDTRRLKHIDIKLNYIRDLVANNVIVVEYIPTQNQPADILTKPLSGKQFLYLRRELGLI